MPLGLTYVVAGAVAFYEARTTAVLTSFVPLYAEILVYTRERSPVICA